MTETAKQADIVLPAASAYEKNGTVTNVCGEVQRLKQAIKVMGTKTDLEIFGQIAKEMGLNLGIWLPDKVFEEIRKNVQGYGVSPAFAARAAALAEERRRSAGMLAELFEFYLENPEKLPENYVEKLSSAPVHRVICDYIAGMTDGFFLRCFEQVLRARYDETGYDKICRAFLHEMQNLWNAQGAPLLPRGGRRYLFNLLRN